MMKLPSPQLVFGMAIMGLFAYGYYLEPGDDTLKGALIGALNLAVGYFLGSSSGSKASGDVVRRIAEQPTATMTGENATLNVGSIEEPTNPHDARPLL